MKKTENETEETKKEIFQRFQIEEKETEKIINTKIFFIFLTKKTGVCQYHHFSNYKKKNTYFLEIGRTGI